VALGLADGARLRRYVEAHAVAVADNELRRAAADVDHDDGPGGVGGPLARRPAERQARLLVARDRARVEAELVADAPGEVRAVGGVADGAREDRDRALRSELVDRGAVLREDGDDALDRLWREAAAGIDALAEAGDDRPALDLADRAGRRVDVRDEQARRVRAEVDDRDARRAARARRGQRSSGSPVMPVSSSAVGPSPGSYGELSGPPGVPSPAPPATPAPPSSPVPRSSTAPSSGGRASRFSVSMARRYPRVGRPNRGAWRPRASGSESV
jgi:hypothetical protein